MHGGQESATTIGSYRCLGQCRAQRSDYNVVLSGGLRRQLISSLIPIATQDMWCHVVPCGVWLCIYIYIYGSGLWRTVLCLLLCYFPHVVRPLQHSLSTPQWTRVTNMLGFSSYIGPRQGLEFKRWEEPRVQSVVVGRSPRACVCVSVCGPV